MLYIADKVFLHESLVDLSSCPVNRIIVIDNKVEKNASHIQVLCEQVVMSEYIRYMKWLTPVCRD